MTPENRRKLFRTEQKVVHKTSILTVKLKVILQFSKSEELLLLWKHSYCSEFFYHFWTGFFWGEGKTASSPKKKATPISINKQISIPSV